MQCNQFTICLSLHNSVDFSLYNLNMYLSVEFNMIVWRWERGMFIFRCNNIS